MVVRAIEPAAGKPRHEPAEERLVVGVHAQRDLRLATVATEVPLADQQPEQDAELVLRGFLRLLFHRHVSRETYRAVVSPSSFP